MRALARKRIDVRIARVDAMGFGATLVTYSFLTLLSCLMFLPMLWAITGSLKESGVLYSYPPRLFPDNWYFRNYVEVFRVVPFLIFAKNSVIITSVALFGDLLMCSLVAYGFSRFRFPGRNLIFILLLSTRMIPPQVILIPRFLLYHKLGWINTFLPLTVKSYFGVNAFFVFLLRQFFLTIPGDYDDAAKIDGAGSLTRFFRIFVPMLKPVIITVTILGFQAHWNEFLGPLIYLQSTDKYTLQQGLAYIRSSYLVGTGGEPHENWLMAASVMVTFPTIAVFFALQRYFIRGVHLSGLKQ
jgi:multiple sugar transport system permease protein